ncbi:hypothetical protein T484DRAFT_2804890 [Baffinella frigidus]|nr:hypothetical protein T484DRAFT_2804890 [Cryptophyta sp. CCMP2293]
MTGNVNPDAHRQLAITYNQLAIELYAARDYAKALTVYDMALEHDPKSSSTYVNRGDCHRDMQEVALALQDYLKAHDLDANDKEINIRISTLYDARGLTYFDRGLLFEAEKEFTLAIKYLPNVTHYYLHRATASYERGNQIQVLHTRHRKLGTCLKLILEFWGRITPTVIPIHRKNVGISTKSLSREVVF